MHGNVLKCVCTRVSFHSCRPLRSFLKFVCMHICVVQIQIIHMRLLPCDALAPFSFSLLPTPMGGGSKGSKGREGKGSIPPVRQTFPLPNGGTLITSEVQWIKKEFSVHTRTGKRDWAKGVQMLFMYAASWSDLEAAKPWIAEFIEKRGTTRFGEPRRAYVQWDSPIREPSQWEREKARQQKVDNRIAERGTTRKGKGKGDDSRMDRSLEEKGGKGKSADGKGKSNIPFAPRVGTATTLMPQRPAASCAAGAGDPMAPMYVHQPAPPQGSPSAGASETECTAAAGPLYTDDSMSEAEREGKIAEKEYNGEPLDEATERYIEQKSERYIEQKSVREGVIEDRPEAPADPPATSHWKLLDPVPDEPPVSKFESEPSDANGAPVCTRGGTLMNESREYEHPHPCPSGVHAGEESSVPALRKLEAGQAEAASLRKLEQDMFDAHEHALDRSFHAARESQAIDAADDAIEAPAPADEIDDDDAALAFLWSHGYTVCVDASQCHGYTDAIVSNTLGEQFRQRERDFSKQPEYATRCRTADAVKAKAKLNPNHPTCPFYRGPQQKRGRSNTDGCVKSNQSQGTGRAKSQGSDGKRQGSSTSSIIEKLSNCIKRTEQEWLQIAMQETMDLVRSEQIKDAQDKLDRIPMHSLSHRDQGVCKEARAELCAIQINKSSKHAKVLLVRTCLQQVQ